MIDTLIVGGNVIDGTGNVGYRAAVAIDDEGRIGIITGDVSGVKARSTIDATGQIVCPGFIDVHTHSDLAALAEPLDEPKIMQGVTTDFIGLDGMGYAPLSKPNLERMLRMWSGISGYPDLDYDWSTVAEYLERYRGTTSTNVGFFVPNGCLRAEVVGWENRPATTDEIRAMQDLLRQGMEEGALGLSTGLTYPPGSYASRDELVELCKTVAECGGVYVTHVRYDMGDKAYDGFREAVKVAELSGCPLHISHYATIIATRGRPERLLSLVDDARARGLDVTFDTYPWPAGSSYLPAALPQWVQDQGPEEMLAYLKVPEAREALKQEAPPLSGDADQLVVSAVSSEKNRWCEGQTVRAIADRLGKDPWDVVCDLLVEENLGVAYYTFTGHMEDVKTIMCHPAQMVCTDGLRIGGMPNPRTYGTYPKILGQMVRDEGVMELEQAIRKMTSFPAQRFGLADRGILRDGMRADVVVFDPYTVSCVATFANPRQFPIGINYVFVNGTLVVDNTCHTKATPGTPLKRA